MSGSLLQKLGGIAEHQWGMFTTRQAASVGVDRSRLSRLAASGALNREAQGVYRMAGVPTSENSPTYVMWLALGGERGKHLPNLVVAGQTATTMHGIGDFYPAGWDFIVPARCGTRLAGVRLRVRSLSAIDVTYLDGLPVLTVERTIADLVGLYTDLSLVADTVRDAVSLGKLVYPERLAGYLDPLAKDAGHEDGHAFLQALLPAA
jgi:predicted transcriptional regulator of viral defense system